MSDPIYWRENVKHDLWQAAQKVRDLNADAYAAIVEGVDTLTLAENKVSELYEERERLLEALVQIRGWREIGHADTLGEKLRAIEAICDRALTNTQGRDGE
jgi:hypothetical protein